MAASRPVSPTVDDLQPLLEALKANTAATEPLHFARGVLLPDGRLDLSSQGLGPDEARTLSAALRQNTVVSAFLLGANALGDAGAAAVAELLLENPRLTTVFLGANGIGAAGAAALADVLRSRETVRGLWLKRNPLGDAGLIALAEALQANKGLQVLDLAHAQVGLAAGEALASALATHGTLNRLYLSGNKLAGRDVAWIGRLLSEAPALTAVFLSANQLGNSGVFALASHLRRNTRLTELGLGSNGLSAAGWQALSEALRHHPSLRVLDLGRSGTADDLTDDSVFFITALLQDSPGLRSLTIDASALTDAGLSELFDAVEASETLTQLNLQRRLRPEQRERLQAALAKNETRLGAWGPSEDVRVIRSVARSGGDGSPTSAPKAKSPRLPSVETEPLDIAPEELEACVRVMEKLARRPGLFFNHTAGMNPIRAGANRLVEAIRQESDARRHSRSQKASEKAKAQRKAHDADVVARTGMRQMRVEELPLLPAPRQDTPPGLLLKPRHCYICKAAYFEVHPYYDSLCPSCAGLNMAKREQSADMRGKTVLITGGRIKIGYEATLKLLRAGARVIMTTRFPVDAAKRFALEPDFAAWRERIEIHGVDLRDIRAVERFASTMAAELDRLDVIINNAAQTVRRPSEFYRHLLDTEAQGRDALPPEVQRIVVERAYHVGAQPVPAAALSQIPLVPDDLVTDPNIFPLAVFDRHGQQRDLRSVNSWTLEVGQIETNEVLETHYVNAIAPFVIINTLLPLMERTPGRKHVVNVSAMEGKFEYARKQSTHPHTNMAKASLNMLTRTSASALAERGIYMNSVDTGWVTNENPWALTEAMRTNLNFEPPLDEIDGAARVLDPVFCAGDAPTFGLFLKDYFPAGW